jgi:hypothetical protein
MAAAQKATPVDSVARRNGVFLTSVLRRTDIVDNLRQSHGRCR